MEERKFNVYVIENATEEDAKNLCHRLGIRDENIEVYPLLKIEDVRQIKQRSRVSTPYPKGFIFGDIRLEAQNALLKLLEEPEPSSYFVIYKTDNLIDTVLSRARIIRKRKEFKPDTELLHAVEANNAAAVMSMLFELQKIPKDQLIYLLEGLSSELAKAKEYRKAAIINRELPRFREYNLNQKLFVFALFFELLGGN